VLNGGLHLRIADILWAIVVDDVNYQWQDVRGSVALVLLLMPFVN